MCGLVSITVVGRPSSCAFLPAAFIYLQFAQAVELKVNRDSVNRFSRAVALSIEARIASLVISKTEIFKKYIGGGRSGALGPDNYIASHTTPLHREAHRNIAYVPSMTSYQGTIKATPSISTDPSP